MNYTGPFSPGDFQGFAELRKNWGWFLALGILLVILGLFAISSSVFVTLLSVIFLGSLILIGGVAQLIYSFYAVKWSGFFLSLLAGILYTVTGFLMVRHPTIGALTLTLLLASFYTVSGVFRIIGSLTMRFQHWGWLLFSGIVSLILGILIFSEWPISGLWIIGLFVGIDMLFIGWSWIIIALSAHDADKKQLPPPPVS
jgi:uncharacterized membrane protein HdeD (DUF308 family)